MPNISFTAHLSQFVPCHPQPVQGRTVRAALEEVFAERPTMRGYLLDDQSRLRQHIMAFIDGQPVTDRNGLSDAVGEDSEIFFMQALSGG
jgi:hypothetical protein